MKKVCTLLLSFLFLSVTKAQFTPGQTLLTGQVSFSDNNNLSYQAPPGFQRGSSLYTSFVLSRFKKPLLLSGFGLSYSHNFNHYNSGTANSDQQSRLHTFQFFYTRSKLTSLAKNLYMSLTGNAGVNYSHNKNRAYNGLSGNDGHTYGGEISGGLGMIYRMDKHFLVNLNLMKLLDLSYSGGAVDYFNPTETYRINSHNFHFETGFTSVSLSSIVFGISYLIK